MPDVTEVGDGRRSQAWHVAMAIDFHDVQVLLQRHFRKTLLKASRGSPNGCARSFTVGIVSRQCNDPVGSSKKRCCQRTSNKTRCSGEQDRLHFSSLRMP